MKSLLERAGNSPINAMKRTAMQSNTSPLWKLVGWSGITAGVLILSFYSVIAGICLNYIFIAALPSDALSSSDQFGAVIASPYNLLFWHTVFMLLTFLIVSAGVKKWYWKNGKNFNANVRIFINLYGHLCNV